MTLPSAASKGISQAKVLVVGAGGIGCELLKNLALSGFRSIEVVDLDVIELSNLNRQFLFRRQHIGQPKAIVASEAVKELCPDIMITPHHGNIKDTKRFPFKFFCSFDLVLNALDNLGARKYVNNMCLTAKIPLVESGTAGYLGQTSVILPGGKSECFECTPKENPKSFPVCTIRTTPSAPIHCIVWAKDFLLCNLFGPILEEDPEENLSEIDNEELLSSLKKEWDSFKYMRELAIKKDENFAQMVFDKVFNEDIYSILRFEELWKTKSPPTPLNFELDTIPDNDYSTLDDHKVWELREWVSLFKTSLISLANRAFDEEKFKEIYFDKDDTIVMDFVSSVANIRAHIFNIPLTSRFEGKSMAGSIIPAIATTNAIVAGMIVLQAINLIKRRFDNCRNAFINYGTRRGTLFSCETIVSPDPECSVCRINRAIIKMNPSKTTLKSFLSKFLMELKDKRGVQVNEMDCIVIEGNRILFDEDFSENLSKSMKDLGCVDSKFLRIDFNNDDINAILIVIDELADDEFSCQFDIYNELNRKRALENYDGSDSEGSEVDNVPSSKMVKINLNSQPSFEGLEDDDDDLEIL